MIQKKNGMRFTAIPYDFGNSIVITVPAYLVKNGYVVKGRKIKVSLCELSKKEV